MFISIRWEVKYNNDCETIVIGQSPQKEGTAFMVKEAINLIYISKYCNGEVFQNQYATEYIDLTANSAVWFSIKFKNMESVMNYINILNKLFKD